MVRWACPIYMVPYALPARLAALLVGFEPVDVRRVFEQACIQHFRRISIGFPGGGDLLGRHVGFALGSANRRLHCRLSLTGCTERGQPRKLRWSVLHSSFCLARRSSLASGITSREAIAYWSSGGHDWVPRFCDTAVVMPTQIFCAFQHVNGAK